ncbi:MAG: alpha/beta hydrolase [Myxococcota bacterium]
MTARRFGRPELGDVQLHASFEGPPNAPCVVLLHGGGANLHWWDEIAPALAREYRVVRLDFRGHGDSDFPETREVGAFHRDLEALCAELGEPPMALVGHSMGGHIALDHAARHAEVWAVVAVEVSFGSARKERRRTQLALALRRSYATREEAVERYRLLPRSPGVPEERRRRLAEDSVVALPDGRFAYKFDPGWFGLPPAPHAALSEVGCPTLVIRGGKSSLLTEEGAEQAAAALPRGDLLEIPDAGHNVHLECPERVADAVLAHLRPHAPESS